MPTDRRLQVLQRLATLLGEVVDDLADVIVDAPAEGRVFRNRDQVPPTLRPAMLLLDGRAPAVLTRKNPRGGPASSIVRLEPGIYALLKERSLDETDQYEAEIAAYHNEIYKAIMFDAGLEDIIGDNGGVEYQGMETDMQDGLLMRGVIQVKFGLHYPLIPSEL